jgi:hypothetical protein
VTRQRTGPDRGTGVPFPAGADIALYRSVQTSSDADPTFYAVGRGGGPPNVWRLGHNADCCRLEARLNIGGAVLPIILTLLWRGV